MVYFRIEDSRLLKYSEKYRATYTGTDNVDEIIMEQTSIPLHITQTNGFNVSPDYNITLTDMQGATTGDIVAKMFHNRGYGGLSFKITVILRTNEKWYSTFYRKYSGTSTNKHDIRTVLMDIIRTMTPVKVVTDAVDIQNGNYIITKNSSRKQTSEGYSIWELEFTQYHKLSVQVYKNDNTRVQEAIKSATAKKVEASTTSASTSTSNKSKFKKCSLDKFKYHKSKKVVACVKYLQKILKNKGYYTGVVDGWYGPLTLKAMKKFQKKYKKKYSLKVTGKMDKKTFNALTKV